MGGHLIKAEKVIVGDGSILHDAYIAVENGKIVVMLLILQRVGSFLMRYLLFEVQSGQNFFLVMG